MLPIEPSELSLEVIDESTVAELEELERIRFLRDNTVSSMEAYFDRLKTEGVIGRNTAQSIKTVSIGLESMVKHFDLYPVVAYTEHPSKTNYEATMESLLGSLGMAVAKASDASFSAMMKIHSEMNKVHRINDEKTKSVLKKLPALLNHFERTPLPQSVVVSPAVRQAIKDLSPMARWFVYPELGDKLTRFYSSPTMFAKDLSFVEESVYQSMGNYVRGGIDRVLDQSRVHELKTFIQTKPDSLSFFSTTADVGRPKTFSDYLTGRIKTIREDFDSHENSRFNELSELQIMQGALKFLVMTQPHMIKFLDAKTYQKYHESINELRSSLVPVVRSGTLNPGEPRLVNDYLNDVRNASHGMLGMENLINQYRQSLMQIVKLVYLYGKTR